MAIEDFVVQLSTRDREHTGDFRLGLGSRKSTLDIFGEGFVGFYLDGTLSRCRLDANTGLSRLQRALQALEGSPV